MYIILSVFVCARTLYVYGYVPSVSLQSKIFIVNKGGIVQFPAHSQEGPFRDCLTVHKDYESRVSMCI